MFCLGFRSFCHKKAGTGLAGDKNIYKYTEKTIAISAEKRYNIAKG